MPISTTSNIHFSPGAVTSPGITDEAGAPLVDEAGVPLTGEGG